MFLAWAWFNHASTAQLSAEEAAEVDADMQRIEELSGVSFRDAEDVPADQVPPSSCVVSGLECMRPNVDDTMRFAQHKPLLVYLLTEFVVGTVLQRRLMSRLGFERHTLHVDSDGQDEPMRLRYWYRAPKDSSGVAHDEPPIVLMHGIGLGWSVCYPPLLEELVEAVDGQRAILAVESPHISLTAPRDYGANPVVGVRALGAMLARHTAPPASAPRDGGVRTSSPSAPPSSSSDGASAGNVARQGQLCADWVAHSYGSLTVAHLLNLQPGLVRSATLVDPVCVGAHRATLCRNFLYAPKIGADEAAAGRVSLEGRAIRWLINHDPRIVGVLMRNFFWYENCLWLDEDLDGAAELNGGAISLFVAENDRYVDGPTIYADARAAMERRAREEQLMDRDQLGGDARARRRLSVAMWPNQDHGAFLANEQQRREVIACVLRSGTDP